MLLRSKLIVLCMAFLISSTSFAQAATKEWSFDVYLDKNKIGQHSFKLTDNGQLVSEANFQVKLLFVTAYKYQHMAKEQWINDCVTDLDATTTENKVLSKVNGHLANGKFEVKSVVGSDEKTQSLPECVMTFAYWNPKILTQTKLLNPQNGEWLNTNIKLLGDEKIVVNGEQKVAKHYHLLANSADKPNDKPKLNIDLWYDANNDWLALQSTTPEGYKIIYRRK